MGEKEKNMEVKRTIRLTHDEQIAISRFIRICDEISDIAKCSMSDVAEYFFHQSTVDNDDVWSVKEIHDVEDIGEME